MPQRKTLVKRNCPKEQEKKPSGRRRLCVGGVASGGTQGGAVMGVFSGEVMYL